MDKFLLGKPKIVMYITKRRRKSCVGKKTESSRIPKVCCEIFEKQTMNSQLLSISSYVKFYLLTNAVFPS